MNIDTIIVFGYLVATLIYGLYVGRNVKDIRDYALGGRNFSTQILAATIFATYASSSGFHINVTESYKHGSYCFLVNLGQVFALFFSSYFIAPRMREFIGNLTVAEIMGSVYGNKVRVIASLPIFLVSAGFLAVQIKVISSLVVYFSDIDAFLCTILTAVIIVVYSAFGGIKAVTFTDFIQFATFGIAIPLIYVVVWGDLNPINDKIIGSKLIDHIFEFDSSVLGYYITMLFYFSMPNLNSPIVQRMLMARNTNQISESFRIAAFFFLAILFFSCMIGNLIYVANPNLQSNDILPFLIENYTFTGLRAIILIGIIALAMSTADSYLNSGSISFSYDFCEPLGIFQNVSQLYLSRLFALIVGILGIIFAIYFKNLISILLYIYNFYAPTITVPMLLGFVA